MNTLRTMAAVLMMALSATTAFAGTPANPGVDQQQKKNATTVYVTKRGKCYHKAKCNKLNVRKAKGMKAYQAEDAKYQPCKRCFPQH